MTKNDQSKNNRKLLWIGLGILVAGLLAFGGFLTFGLISLARDLFLTAIFADFALAGGVLGKKAIDGIADRIGTKKGNKKQLRKRNIEQTQEKVKETENTEENVENIEPIVHNVEPLAKVNPVRPGKTLRNSVEEAIKRVQKDGTALYDEPEEIKDNKRVALTAIRENCDAFMFVSERLLDDKEIVIEAVKQNGLLLCYASPRLKKDKEVVMAAGTENIDALECVYDYFKSDKEFLDEVRKSNVAYLSEKNRNASKKGR